MTKIVNTSRVGDFVHAGQDMAADVGFRNVSRLWLNQCIPMDQGIQSLQTAHRVVEDHILPIEAVTPGVDGQGNFVMFIEGKPFRPTEYALSKMAVWGKSSTWYYNSLVGPECDHKDAEALVVAVKNSFRRVQKGKLFTWRTWADGTLRAMLSDQYACVNNGDLMDLIAKCIPGGMLSHWRSDADTLFGNVLIPDTIREEDDSDYGGILHLSNCEIGTRRIDVTPGTFRAICMNGCIWGEVEGVGINRRHRGEINWEHLKADIVKTINDQIPLTVEFIDTFLKTKAMETNIAMNPIIAEACEQFKVAQFGPKVLAAFTTEVQQTNINPQTLFALINGFTRASQAFGDAHMAVKVDTVAGQLSRFSPTDWQRLTTRAASMKADKVDAILGLAA